MVFVRRLGWAWHLIGAHNCLLRVGSAPTPESRFLRASPAPCPAALHPPGSAAPPPPGVPPTPRPWLRSPPAPFLLPFLLLLLRPPRSLSSPARCSRLGARQGGQWPAARGAPGFPAGRRGRPQEGARRACERSGGRREEGARRSRSRPCAALGPLGLARGGSLGWALAVRPASGSRVRLRRPAPASGSRVRLPAPHSTPPAARSSLLAPRGRACSGGQAPRRNMGGNHSHKPPVFDENEEGKRRGAHPSFPLRGALLLPRFLLCAAAPPGGRAESDRGYSPAFTWRAEGGAAWDASRMLLGSSSPSPGLLQSRRLREVACACACVCPPCVWFPAQEGSRLLSFLAQDSLGKLFLFKLCDSKKASRLWQPPWRSGWCRMTSLI